MVTARFALTTAAPASAFSVHAKLAASVRVHIVVSGVIASARAGATVTGGPQRYRALTKVASPADIAPLLPIWVGSPVHVDTSAGAEALMVGSNRHWVGPPPNSSLSE